MNSEKKTKFARKDSEVPVLFLVTTYFESGILVIKGKMEISERNETGTTEVVGIFFSISIRSIDVV